MIHKTYQVSMEVAGDTALWTRPDTGDSPCSYPAPTYSAVRGLFESILGVRRSGSYREKWNCAPRRSTTPMQRITADRFESPV